MKTPPPLNRKYGFSREGVRHTTCDLSPLVMSSYSYYLTTLTIGDPRGANYVRTTRDLSPLVISSCFYYLTTLAVGDPRGANYVRTSRDLSPLVVSSNKKCEEFSSHFLLLDITSGERSREVRT